MPVIEPETRQQRIALFERLTADNDATLAAVRRSFAARNITLPDAIASGWLLAQNWANAIRAEAVASAKIPDETTRRELAEASRRILIVTAETELRGMLGREPDAGLLSELEAVGRSLKDSPPPPAELIPGRAAGAAAGQRPKRRARAVLEPEEE